MFPDIYPGDPVGMPYGFHGRKPCNPDIVAGHTFRSIAVAEDMTEQLLEPCTGSRIAAPQQVEMVTVPVHIVSDERCAGILDGGPGWDNDTDSANANLTNRGNAVRNYGTMTINGGLFTACDNYINGGFAYAIANGSSAYPDAEMIINDATVYGSINGLLAADGGKITVNGGTYTLGDGTETNLWRIVYTSGNGTVVLNDGTFTRNVNNDYAFFGANGTGSITVNGGIYKDLVHDYIRVDGDMFTVINGGTFDGGFVGEMVQFGSISTPEVFLAFAKTVNLGNSFA